LIEDFKSRLVDCNDWIENAKDKETKIRASAVKTFIAEVILTINNAPTVEYTFEEAFQKTVCENKLYCPSRPQGKWIRKVDEAGFISHICSKCGAEIEVEDPKDDKFCFNCGAEMKGGAEEC
jgi:ribosomal protein L40E